MHSPMFFLKQNEKRTGSATPDDLLTFWTYLSMRSVVTVIKLSDWHAVHAVVVYARSDDQQQHGDTQSSGSHRSVNADA